MITTKKISSTVGKINAFVFFLGIIFIMIYAPLAHGAPIFVSAILILPLLIALYFILCFSDVYVTSDKQLIIKNYCGKVKFQGSLDDIDESYHQLFYKNLQTIVIKNNTYHFFLSYRRLFKKNIFKY